MDRANAPDAVDVAIIGGGAAGILAAIHVLRESAGAASVLVVEPRSQLGEGAAYSTRDSNHLLNVRAGGMSAFADDPGHLVRTTGEPAERFLPRADFARYLRTTLDAQADGRPLHVRDEAVDVTGTGPYRVALRSGRVIEAGAVVLALGNMPRALDAALSGDAAQSVVHAWDYPAVAAIAADAAVCIVGSGLSMVDVAMTLQAGGHRGPIRVLSRHGLLPLSHAEGHGPQEQVDDAIFAGDIPQRMRLLRAMARARTESGQPWQWAMDLLRPHGRALWHGLGEVERRRFLRHVRPYWDIHRHRIAPEIASRLSAMQTSGQLAVEAGTVASIQAGPHGVDIGFRHRGSDRIEHMRIDTVVACTGIEPRLLHVGSPLVQALAKRGTIAPGPLGLGLAIGNAAGALLDTEGRLQPRLLTIGSPRIGQDWESTAIPEIRAQAAGIAGWLRESGLIG